MRLLNAVDDVVIFGDIPVSILVLMDASLELVVSVLIQSDILSFNPCFNGCVS